MTVDSGPLTVKYKFDLGLDNRPLTITHQNDTPLNAYEEA